MTYFNNNPPSKRLGFTLLSIVSPFKALLNTNMDAYCTIKILMFLTNANANVLKNNTDLLIMPLR